MSRRIHAQRDLSDRTGTGPESRAWAQGSASVEEGGMGTMQLYLCCPQDTAQVTFPREE